MLLRSSTETSYRLSTLMSFYTMKTFTSSIKWKARLRFILAAKSQLRRPFENSDGLTLFIKFKMIFDHCHL